MFVVFSFACAIDLAHLSRTGKLVFYEMHALFHKKIFVFLLSIFCVRKNIFTCSLLYSNVVAI